MYLKPSQPVIHAHLPVARLVGGKREVVFAMHPCAPALGGAIKGGEFSGSVFGGFKFQGYGEAFFGVR